MSQALTGRDASSWTGLQKYGVNIGGWAAGGINYNINNPSDRSNGPVSMTDRNEEFHLYQLNLFIEKAVTKASTWDVGGRFDFMFGTDTRYTQATGHWDMGLISQRDLRFYDIALPQAYVEVFAPIGNGLSGKFGHFYTIIGYESVPSPPNFFSSHTYSFKSSPFTTTGALFSYALNEQWSVNLGAVTGADNFDRDLGAWSHMSGLTWTNADTGTTVSFSIMQGDVYKNQSSELVYYSAILQQNLGKWHYVLQHDRGAQQNAIAQGQNADWYSIVQYLTYDIDDQLGVGLRGEWFRDQNGFRYSAGEAGYYAMTVGLNWKPKGWLMIRPEVRYDWSEAQLAPFDAGHQIDQVLLGIDAVVQF
ncbi:porin [Methylomicrobium sp. Wu6]|uniref:porin n=1 Tax=Methylomicrobium sp. Wu6 TaxID=3107928 RepID=UPI002DD68741|nr:porin [Methylomicrobium sp. Wu6]MEC4748508.1 porin [Methylomicrobium sp. Wu6]